MKRPATVVSVESWTHNPTRRKARFRCQNCMKLIADGSSIVIERRPHGAHGYHKECFRGIYAEAALSRQAEKAEGRS